MQMLFSCRLVAVLLAVLVLTGCYRSGLDVDFVSIEACVTGFPDMTYRYNDAPVEVPHDRFAITVMARANPEFDLYNELSTNNPLVSPVIDITIVTIGDYNEDYPDGSVINEAFAIAYRMAAYSPIPWPAKNDAPAYITHSTAGEANVSFVVRTFPQPGEHQFCVNYTLADGRVLSATTQKVTML